MPQSIQPLSQSIQTQPLTQSLQPLQSLQGQALPQSMAAQPLASIQGQQFSFLSSQPLPSLAQTNQARMVSSAGPANINLHHHHHQAMGDIHTVASVNPSLMSLALSPA